MILIPAYILCFLTLLNAVKGLEPRRRRSGLTGNVTHGKYSEEPLLNLTERLRSYGYPASEHSVQTEDGYVLRVHRVRGGAGRAPVLLMHGLLQSGAAWLDAGRGAALAHLLAAAGRDLWLGNARGSHYSRRHAWLDPDADSHYWRFCVDEIGRYDLPATVAYVLAHTRAPKLDYIGYSQGGGAFFIMCSERPDYCDKINVMIALAPATRMLRTKSRALRAVLEYYETNEEKLNNNGVWEVLPVGGLFQSLAKVFCSLFDSSGAVCETFKDIFDASNPGSIKKATFQTVFHYNPAGTSVHNMARYGQSLKSTNFQKFDYGPEQNLIYYGSTTPPVYNLSAVTVPTVVIYGRNDGDADYRDVKWLVKQLPNVIEASEVEDPRWTHVDFMFSKNIPKFVYPKIEKYLDKGY